MKYKYGILHDHTIVRIRFWNAEDDSEKQEIYFKYLPRIKRKTAWAYKGDFIWFSESYLKAKKHLKLIRPLSISERNVFKNIAMDRFIHQDEK